MSDVSGPSTTLFQRLAALRAQLDRVARDLTVLSADCTMDADRQLRDLQERFRGALYHLELTLDYLTPLGNQEDRPFPPAAA